MHEVALLSRLIEAGSLQPYAKLGLRDEHFQVWGELWQFLKQYQSEHNKLPRLRTVRAQFPDFKFEVTSAEIEWLADEVQQEYLAGRYREIMLDTNKAVEVNPRDGIRDLMGKLNEFHALLGNVAGDRTPIIDYEAIRASEAARRAVLAQAGLIGATTGFALLDEVTHGTMPGEIEIYMARPGDGKSITLLYSCLRSWEQGKAISFVSPEMSLLEMGWRLDALQFHISMSALFGGKLPPDAVDYYRERVFEMMETAKERAAFWFREPRGFRRFTTADMAAIIETDKPDVLAIDGLLLLDPVKKFRDNRERVINIMDELKQIVVITGVPMRIAHQANRQSELRGAGRRGKDMPIADKLPELHHAAESGAVEQFANRVLTMKLHNGRMYLKVLKNRNGPTGRTISCVFDIDRGEISDEKDVYDATKTARASDESDTIKDIPF
jgi:DnaB helicase-like protein